MNLFQYNENQAILYGHYQPIKPTYKSIKFFKYHYSEDATLTKENIAVVNFLKCKSNPFIKDYDLK